MKSIKILGVLAIVGTSLISFTPAFADEVNSNESSQQVTLQTIEEENNVQYDGNHSIQERGWGDFLGGLLGGLSKSPTAEELNGSRTKDFKAKNCGPYGQGGTPNSCNFRR